MSDVLIKVADGKKLNKEQESFNKLIEQIQKRQAEVEKIQNNLKMFVEARACIIGDLPQKEDEARVGYATMMDRMYESKSFTKKEKEKIANIIFNVIKQHPSGQLSEERKKLFDKYQELVYGTFSDDEMEENRELFEHILESFGLEIDLSDVKSLTMAELKQKIDDYMRKQEREEMEGRKEEENFQRKNKFSSDLSGKAKETAEKLNKSWKQIYLSLVKALHPDTVTDEEEKTGKEAALKEVTEAYDTNNFFRLLQLQIQYGGMDSLLNDAKPEVIAQFTAILKSQSQDLQQTLLQLKDSLKDDGVDFLYKKDAEKKMNNFLQDKRYELEAIVEGLKRQTFFHADVSALKKTLKNVTMSQLSPDF